MKLTYMIAFVFAIQIGLAQNRISGSVRDEATGAALIGATIYFHDLKTGTITDRNGNYVLKSIRKGIHLVGVSAIGYRGISRRVFIDRDAVLDFVLNESATELDEVVVTGVSRSTELKLSPVVIKPVDMTQLNQNSSTNLIDALKTIPGVSQITTGAAISKPTIRGLGYNRVISLYNGIRQEGQQWGDEHGIEIDQYAVERVEIIKGPGSLMYGSDGIAGVLNFLSPRAPADGETKTQLVSNYQTNNKLIGYSISNAGNKNGFQWLVRASNKFAGNYQNKYDGKVYNSGFREYNANVFLGLNKSWGFTHLNVSSFNNEINMPEGDRDSRGLFVFDKPDGNGGVVTTTATADDLKGYHIGFPHQVINHLRVQSNNLFVLNKGAINFDAGFQNSKRKEFGDVLRPEDKALFFDLSTFNSSIRYNFDEVNRWETALGVSNMIQSNANKGLEFLIPAYTLFDVGGFVFTQKKFNKVVLSGGLRFDNRNLNVKELILDSLERPVTVPDATTAVKFVPLRKSYSSYSGSIGMSYPVSKNTTLKLNVSRGFRAPNIAEIASNGRHEGTFRYEYGSSELKPEISHQIDVAYFYNTKHVTLEVTPFANFISNYIFSEKLAGKSGNDSIPDPSDPAPAFKFGQGNATLVGGEFYLDIHPHPLDWLHIENSFSYVRATQNNQPDSSRYLPFIPQPRYRGELKAQFERKEKTLSNVYGKIALDYYFKQDHYFSAFSTETGTPAYGLLSAGIGTNVRGNGRADFVCIYVSAENLTNVSYQSHLSRLKYAPPNPLTGRNGIFNMGRNLSVRIILTL